MQTMNTLKAALAVGLLLATFARADGQEKELAGAYEKLLGFTPVIDASTKDEAQYFLKAVVAHAEERRETARDKGFGELDDRTLQSLLRWQLLTFIAKMESKNAFEKSLVEGCNARQQKDAEVVHLIAVYMLDPMERQRQALIRWYVNYGIDNQPPSPLSMGLVMDTGLKSVAKHIRTGGAYPEGFIFNDQDMMMVLEEGKQRLAHEQEMETQRELLRQAIYEQQQQEARSRLAETMEKWERRQTLWALERIADALENR